MNVERAGVIGAGVMGSEIAQVMAAAGVHVVMRDVSAEALDAGVARVRAIGERAVTRGRMSQEQADAILERITTTVGDADLAGCDIAIEAVSEVMAVKRTIFRALDAVLPPDALLASNTSGLSITALGRETGRPAQVVGMHFFNPASVMRLVEVIEGEDTAEASVAAALDLVERLGKTPVRVRECPGFLVNRVLMRAAGEAYRRAEELGADRGAADAAVAEGPAPMGPFALGDLVGLDTMDHVRRDLQEAYGDRFAAGSAVADLVAQGRLGRKTKGGFFTGPTEPVPPDDAGRDVAERYYLGALHEACLCLDEGIAALPDIDLAMRLGCGWAIGPLAWADSQGLAAVAGRLEALAGEAGPRFRVPAPLAERAAGSATFLPPT
jgi:3-hydroxyacyl-CoA dehydrogenase